MNVIVKAKMNFIEAVKSGFRKYFDFVTRASRSEYWYWILFYIIATFLVGFMQGIFRGSSMMLIFWIVMLMPTIGVTVRRMHDCNRSGLWILIVFIPFGVFLLLFFLTIRGTEGPNDHGEDPLDPNLDAASVFD